MVHLFKFSQFFGKHWKLIIVIYLVFSLFDYYFYLQEENLAEKKKERNWPIHTILIKRKRNQSLQTWHSKSKILFKL